MTNQIKIKIELNRKQSDAAIEGRKVTVILDEQKGEIGDTFDIFDSGGVPATFRIIEVIAVDLETAANIYFRMEGLASPAEFRANWRADHGGHYHSDKLYYMHIFGRVVSP